MRLHGRREFESSWLSRVGLITTGLATLAIGACSTISGLGDLSFDRNAGGAGSASSSVSATSTGVTASSVSSTSTSTGTGMGGATSSSSTSTSSGPGGAGGGVSTTSYWVGVPTSSSLYETNMDSDSALYGVTYQIPPGVSGSHTAIYLYKSGGPGYAAGTGGDYTISLYHQDAQGNPTGMPVAQSFWLAAGANNEPRRQVLWDPPAVVNAGEYYIAVWKKTDGTGATNWCSLDFNAIATSPQAGTGNPSEPMPWQGNQREWGHRIALDGATWAYRDEAIFEPIMEVEVANLRYGRAAVGAQGEQLGPAPGGGWYEIWLHPTINPKTVTATDWVRQHEIPLAAGTIDQLVGSFRYVSGSGNLVYELYLDTQLIATKTVSGLNGAFFAAGAPQKTLGGALPQPVDVIPGVYYLQARTTDTLVLATGGMADGSLSYGYAQASTDAGHMDTSNDSGVNWTYNDRYGAPEPPTPDADLPYGIQYIK